MCSALVLESSAVWWPARRSSANEGQPLGGHVEQQRVPGRVHFLIGGLQVIGRPQPVAKLGRRMCPVSSWSNSSAWLAWLYSTVLPARLRRRKAAGVRS